MSPLWHNVRNPDDHDPDEVVVREVENLIGWRKMKVLPVGLLVSPFREGGMTSDISEEAVCGNNDSHDAPEEHCSPGCGWYAFYDSKEITKRGGWTDRFGMDEAIVEVSAVGKTWLHDKGFRTKQIRMETIWVPKGMDTGLVETLAEMYSLPVYEIPGREEAEDSPTVREAEKMGNLRITDPTFNWGDHDIWSKQKLMDLPRPLISTDDAFKHFMGVTKDEWDKQYLGGVEPWKSESAKSSSPPSPQSEPRSKSPLTSGREAQQKKELDSLKLGLPSPFGLSPRDRKRAEYDLANARAELSRAMGKCMLCDKTGIHTHDDLDELMGKPNA